MGLIRIIGSRGELLNPDREWSKKDGNLLVHRYDGVYETLLQEMVRLRGAPLPPDRVILQATEGPMAQLTVYYGAAEDDATADAPVSEFELIPNQLQNGIKQLPYWHIAPAVTDAEFKAIDDAIAPSGTLSISLGAKATELYARLLKGVDSYEEDQWVLTHTMTVSSRYTTQISFNRINYIYSTANLLAEQVDRGTPIPDEILWPMSGFDVVQPTGPKPAALPAAFTWGWRKMAPKVVRSGGDRYQIIQEWALYAWDTDVIYEAYV